VASSKTVREQRIDIAIQEVYWCRPAPVIVDKAADQVSKLVPFYTAVADRLGRDTPITYLEFGVAQGLSMRHISGLFSNPASRFHGFDSFVGLPEDWLMHKQGSFTNHGRPPITEDSRISFIKGWFQNTVPKFLEEFRPRQNSTLLLHFDSDLYSSTLFLLSTLWMKIPEYYFIFDDFIYDECVALQDFLSAFPVQIEFLIQTRGGGYDRPNPDQVFGSLARTEFTIAG
jgi:Macrocin-O-methyltransferase (TylF)